MWHLNTTYFIRIKKNKLEPAIIWKLVTCQRITSKNTRPRWVDTWARDTVRWYWSADTLFWQLSIDHNIDVQSVFSWAPKLARKCESKHWFPCGAVGQPAGSRCTVTWLPNFLGWVDLLTHGAPLQTVITFKILKGHRGFCIFSITHDLSFRLFGLELSARSQTSEISF